MINEKIQMRIPKDWVEKIKEKTGEREKFGTDTPFNEYVKSLIAKDLGIPLYTPYHKVKKRK